MPQLILHLLGDYVLQSHDMALNKRTSSAWAFIHALTYSLPFLLIGSWTAVAIIFGTHFLIDRFGLAAYLVYFKNQLFGAAAMERFVKMEIPDRPWEYEFDNWRECKKNGGYPPSTPPWLATWLTIVADNTLHLACNIFALSFF